MNIEIIAEKANVSRSTVSRVLNNNPKVKQTTREAVLRVMEELDYVPNAAARSLASKRSNVIGLLVYNIVQPFWAGIYSGVESYVSRNSGYGMFLANSKSHLDIHDYKEDYKRNLKNLILRGVDGLIIALGNDLKPDDIEYLESTGVPYVVIQCNLEDNRVTRVNVDNVEGAYHATRHLIRLGHRDITHATGPIESGISRDRLQGYKKAMLEAGLSISGSSIVTGGFLYEDGHTVMNNLLKGKRVPTAVLFASDVAAFGGYRAAQEHGLAVPEDLSIVGFDHLTSSMDIAALLPDLTSVIQPVHKIGGDAASLLLQKLEGKDVHSMLIPMDLHNGATTRQLAPP